MKKKYLIEFTYADGSIEEVELTTDNIKWSIEQYGRNRQVVSHTILESSSSEGKQMLFG